MLDENVADRHVGFQRRRAIREGLQREGLLALGVSIAALELLGARNVASEVSFPFPRRPDGCR